MPTITISDIIWFLVVYMCIMFGYTVFVVKVCVIMYVLTWKLFISGVRFLAAILAQQCKVGIAK